MFEEYILLELNGRTKLVNASIDFYFEEVILIISFSFVGAGKDFAPWMVEMLLKNDWFPRKRHC